MRRVGSVVGDEARGYHAENSTAWGLNLWAPVVNLLRDPRWGRNEEGYSEDPYLTGVISTAYGQGMEGDNPTYLKTAPTLKHFLAYNNEVDRGTSSSVVRPRVLHEYDEQAFEPALRAGAATGVMSSYNLVNGRPNTVTPLLNAIRAWSRRPLFNVSDAGAPSNLTDTQAYFTTPAQAYAAAIKAGMDSFTQDNTDPTAMVDAVTAALQQGLLTEKDVDTAVGHALSIRFRLGEFDPDGGPSAKITPAVINDPAHRKLARQTADQAAVLLKNSARTLPLNAATTKKVAVVGPLADTVYTDWYSGSLPYQVTPLEGIRNRVASGTTVTSSDGLDRIALRDVSTGKYLAGGAAAGGAVIAENAGPANSTAQFDVSDWGQGIVALRSVANGKYIGFHAGQETGNAIADVLFGDYNPSGRLTQTWYRSTSDLPDILDYDIIKDDRTYQYFTGTPLYPMGYGLSYTNFRFGNLRLSSARIDSHGSVKVSVDVTNTGSRSGAEIVQLYTHEQKSRVKQPIKQLKAFQRVELAAGQRKAVQLTLKGSDLAFWDVTRNKSVVESGSYDLMAGASSSDIRATGMLRVSGEVIPARDLTRSTRAENFDDYQGTTLVDESKSVGTSIAATAAGNWAEYADADLRTRATTFSARVADPGTATSVEIRLDSAHGTLLGTARIPATADQYTYTDVSAALKPVSGRHDVYLVFNGPARMSTFSVR